MLFGRNASTSCQTKLMPEDQNLPMYNWSSHKNIVYIMRSERLGRMGGDAKRCFGLWHVEGMAQDSNSSQNSQNNIWSVGLFLPWCHWHLLSWNLYSIEIYVCNSNFITPKFQTSNILLVAGCSLSLHEAHSKNCKKIICLRFCTRSLGRG